MTKSRTYGSDPAVQREVHDMMKHHHALKVDHTVADEWIERLKRLDLACERKGDHDQA